MICIGIDPGEHTGLAVWDTETQAFAQLTTVPLHRALLQVLTLKESGETIHVTFEDARQRQWLPRERNLSEYRGRLMGAGAAKRDARIWEEFLTDNAIPFTAVPPRKGATKWSPDTFARVTGYTGRTSNHARDAALLVFQRTKYVLKGQNMSII